ncbi:MAG TPA: class II glutamine amidotransferase [Longimicrobiales bacterium]
MCRLFGMASGPERVRATFWLLDARDSLARQSRREPDGTGLGWYDPETQPERLRDPEPAWRDPAFSREAREVQSRTFIAHVRLASVGGLTVQNTHPFLMQGRMLAHNGHIGGLHELEARLGPARELVQGDTDSERFLALVTVEAERLGDVEKGLLSAARWVAEHLPLYALNVILTTPTDLWALRYPETHELWVFEREPHGGRHLDAASAAGTVRVRSQDLARLPSVIVASEPMTDSHGWTLMEPGELLHVDRRLGTTRRVALPDPPKHQLRLQDLEPRAAESQRSR